MIETTIKITRIVANDGMVLTNGNVFSKEIYLGKYDKPENWREITEEDAQEIIKQREEV